jgi:capsular exopolysaccharide synthesis family protein
MASNLSSGGLCCYIETRLDFRQDDEVEISFILDDDSGEKAVFEGVVLRSKPAIAGYHFSTTAIQFVNVNDSLTEQIKNRIRHIKSGASYSLPPQFEEPIRGLRSDLIFMNSQGMSSFLITSCGPQEGKSTVVSNLAISLAEINKRVIVIDANLRTPSLHRIWNLSNETGLSRVLSAEEQPFFKNTKSGVSVLTSGPPISDPSALLGSYRMLQLIKSLSEEFDFILFDSPPLLAGPDSSLLASMVHGAIIVLNAGSTTVDDFRRAKQILDRSHAKTLGIVMNNFEDELASYYTWS